MYGDLEDLKARLGITVDSKDDILTDILEVAAAHIDRKCGRRFNTVSEEALPTTRSFRVSGSEIFTDDLANTDDLTVTIDGTEVTIFTAERASYAWPYQRLLLETSAYHGELAVVEGHFGWPDTPVEVTEASLLLAHRLYKRAETPSGVGGFDQTGATFRLPWRDPDVELMLAPYRRLVLA